MEKKHTLANQAMEIKQIQYVPWNLDDQKTNRALSIVDVFVTSECIHLYILCIVPWCLFREVSVMSLSHVMPQCSYREIQ